MPHPFLTPEWIDEVRAIRDEYWDEVSAAAASVAAPAFRANLVVTSVPFADDRRVLAHADTTDGAIEIELGHLPEVDVTVTLSYKLARSLIVDQDPQAAAMAWISGKIRVDGDLTKLLPTTDPAVLVATASESADHPPATEIGARLRAATA